MSGLLLVLFSTILSWITSVLGDSNDTDGFKSDPYLQYKPEFARSLPVQILVTGVVLTLVAVLFIHIVFTGQYHWPLAPVNYILQLSGVITLLISLIATLNVVLAQTLTESARWPYMLSYIAVYVPPLDVSVNNSDSSDDTDGLGSESWSLAERATWLIMNATVSGLVQITHIQFLTLLYPSQLEGRLIFSLLGPLAILAAVVQLIPINGSSSFITVANDIRNVCNATLSLLFTTSLFVWGLLVNRRQAWRTDGGTAVFGASALTLAIISTALNILYVPKNDQYVWLPGLMWAVVLWQSFLGWWWWVGAGSGHTTDDVVEEVLRRGEKIARRRKQTRQKRLEARRAKKKNNRNAGDLDQDQDQEDEMSSEQEHNAAEHRNSLSGTESPTNGSGRRSSDGMNTGSGTSVSAASVVSEATYVPRFLPKVAQAWYINLRQAHVTAARRQTVERVERIREMERERMDNHRRSQSGVSGLGTLGIGSGSGWGLGSFGLRMGRTDAELFEMESNPRRRRRPSEEPRTSSSDDGCFSDDQRRAPRSKTQAASRPKKRSKSDVTPHSNTAVDADGNSGGRRKSMWWWGPFERWRLQDSTVY